MGNQIGYEQYGYLGLAHKLSGPVWGRGPRGLQKIFQNESKHSSTKACVAY